MVRLKNPLPEVMLDPSGLTNFYKEWNLLPYAGRSSRTGHSFLRILDDLYDLSPSKGTVVEDIKGWAFEGEIEIVRRKIEGLKVDQQDEVSDDEALAFAEYLEEVGITLPAIIELTQELEVSMSKNGNAWLHCVEVEIDGIWYVTLGVIDSQSLMYLNSDPGEPKSVVWSLDFFNANGFQKEPRVLRVYPNVQESAGLRETVFHVKNKRDHSDWYGRPKALQTLYWQFIEWSQTNLIAKISNSEIGVKGLLVQEAPPISSMQLGEDNSAEKRVVDFGRKLRKLATQKGSTDEMESLGVIEYPHGLTPPQLLTFDINRDSAYTELILDRASDAIHAGHGWSKVLTGWEKPEGGIGGNVLIDEFKVRNIGTIKPLQAKWARFWKMVIGYNLEQNGVAEFDGMGIRFEDNIQSLIESLKGSSANDTQESPEAAQSAAEGNDNLIDDPMDTTALNGQDNG